MSGIKKLFKKKEKKAEAEQPTSTPGYESVNSASLQSMSPSELLNIIYRYNSEVKILNTSLGELKGELSASRSMASQMSDEAALHKEYNEKLNKELHDSSTSLKEHKTELESLKKELALAQSQIESKEELLQNYKLQIENLSTEQVEVDDNDQVRTLKAKLKEYKANEQKLQELVITNKMLENASAKHVLDTENLNAKIKTLSDRNAELEKDAREMELKVYKKDLEIENEKKQVSMLVFQKESVETESKGLRENLQHKEKTLAKSENKVEKTQNELRGKIEELYELSNQINKTKQTHDDNICKLKIEHSEALQKQREDHEVERSSLKKRIVELEEAVSAGEQEVIDESEQQIEQLLQENKDVLCKLKNQEEENEQLKKRLAELQVKQNSAKNELIKLSQKLQEKQSSSRREDFKINPLSVSPSELKPLSMVHKELDHAYKTLMTIMVSTATEITIPVPDFIDFERKINTVLMQVHEAAEFASSQFEANQWGNKLSEALKQSKAEKSRAPVKLFSCIRADDDNSSIMQVRSIQGKKLVSNTGGLVQQREPVVDQEIANKRRGSVGYGKLN